jgi:hypothetical protein
MSKPDFAAAAMVWERGLIPAVPLADLLRNMWERGEVSGAGDREALLAVADAARAVLTTVLLAHPSGGHPIYCAVCRLRRTVTALAHSPETTREPTPAPWHEKDGLYECERCDYADDDPQAFAAHPCEPTREGDALAVPADSCAWTENQDGAWMAHCGPSFEFVSGGPVVNRFRACCYCGKILTEVPYVEDDEVIAREGEC